MEVTDAGMVMEASAVDWNALFPISVHPSPSSRTVADPAVTHMALVKIVLPEEYDMSTMSKEPCVIQYANKKILIP
jgi:hypothetical protein